jgi:hypothetical protein
MEGFRGKVGGHHILDIDKDRGRAGIGLEQAQPHLAELSPTTPALVTSITWSAAAVTGVRPATIPTANEHHTILHIYLPPAWVSGLEGLVARSRGLEEGPGEGLASR